MKKQNEKNRDNIEFSMPLNKQLLKYVVIILCLVFAFYLVVAMPEKISRAISVVLNVFSPFLIGFCFAYVVNLLLRPLERFWNWCWRKINRRNVVDKLKRPVCLTLSILIVLGAVFAITFMIIPKIADTVVSFADKVPQYAKTVEGWYHTTVDFFEKYNFSLPEITLDTAKITELVKDLITKYGNNVLDTTVNLTTSIVTLVVDVVLGIVFSVYLLAQKEKLGKQTTKIVRALLPHDRAERLIDFTSLTNRVFTKFVTGQLTEACIIGVLCFLGMIIFGMPYAAIISVLVGFTALIPIFGAFIGTGVGAFLILLESPLKAFWFIVFIVILQQIEGNLIYPRVVGKSVGLPGIWVLVAVTVGGGLFGLAGMLFSVPVCSVLYIVFRKYINKKTALNVALQRETDAETEKSDI